MFLLILVFGVVFFDSEFGLDWFEFRDNFVLMRLYLFVVFCIKGVLYFFINFFICIINFKCIVILNNIEYFIMIFIILKILFFKGD